MIWGCLVLKEKTSPSDRLLFIVGAREGPKESKMISS